ncbi:MAG TPA: helix-turn-helix transcriptional regulator [Clostridiales bacterium]|jgi:DNA-binding XRE family transcriptional regulator|nr:helix-turn-helix transcriptional regulator [Clostridiales bacterium]
MSFSENLKKIRKDNNMSQEEFAEMMGVSRQAVSKWESDEGYPEVEKLLIISRKLNVSLDSLMCSEILTNEVGAKVSEGAITIVSPNEGIIATCSKVMKSQEYKGGKRAPKYALFAQNQQVNSFWGTTNTFLGWYMTEESILQEIKEIHDAIVMGNNNYELKYSVRCKKSFFKIAVQD